MTNIKRKGDTMSSNKMNPLQLAKNFVKSEYVVGLNDKIVLSLKRNKLFLKIKNKDVYYNHETKTILPNFETFKFSSQDVDSDSFNNSFEDYEGELINSIEFKSLQNHTQLNQTNIPVVRLQREKSCLLNLIRNGLIPENLTTDEEIVLNFLIKTNDIFDYKVDFKNRICINENQENSELNTDEELLKNEITLLLTQLPIQLKRTDEKLENALTEVFSRLENELRKEKEIRTQLDNTIQQCRNEKSDDLLRKIGEIKEDLLRQRKRSDELKSLEQRIVDEIEFLQNEKPIAFVPKSTEEEPTVTQNTVTDNAQVHEENQEIEIENNKLSTQTQEDVEIKMEEEKMDERIKEVLAKLKLMQNQKAKMKDELDEDVEKHNGTSLLSVKELLGHKINNNQTHLDSIDSNIEKLKATLLELNNNEPIDDLLKEIEQPTPKPRPQPTSYATIGDTLLECDHVRADLDPYDPKILTDPNRGHWDLWGVEQTVNIARNPAEDVRFDGVIGIDFGTKSTVVVYQESTEHTLPLRVGTGNLSKDILPSHYENPTILEFVDLQSFLSAYKEKDGRPNTKWEHLTTSHTAFDNFFNSNSEQYYSFLYELKQWAGDKNRKIHLRDKNGYNAVLKPYLNLTEEDFDPIEIYAYYLGLYINNMHNGIYLEYLLSYPVTYEKSIRSAVLDSFTRGLKKSLPKSILDDDSIMKDFSVSLGATEPVAYAICALSEYGFEPEVDEEIFYCVFDFGGGTTDFDFGIIRGVDEDRYDFVVQSIDSSGDKFLGGENLLDLLAYEVFKKNHNILRQNEICFERPTECKRFAGDEVLISNSQEAKLNMTQLKEILRLVWEKTENYEEAFQDGEITVNLYDLKGEQRENIVLKTTVEELNKILTKRIEEGVSNFFFGMIKALNTPEKEVNINKIHIILAGNSSKSKILQDIMEEHTITYCDILNNGDDDVFEIFPPLGTEQSNDFLTKKGIKINSALESPTCKTGVAFGLVKSRQGGRTRVVTNDGLSDEIKFPYYIGKARRGKFHHIIEPSLDYEVWTKFIDASEEKFTIYYSKTPSAISGATAIQDVERKLCKITEINPNANIYIRTISPSVIEYVVATQDGIVNNEYLTQPVTIILNVE